MFYDRAKIHVAAGRGGNGAVSFRREKHVPRGGPDGGDGGRGGDIWIVADPQLRDLARFGGRVHFKAGKGGHGSGQRRHGASGADLELSVPLGTQIRDDDALVADLTSSGQRFLAAEGGEGGRGNARFVASTRQAPKFAELGEEGESRWLRLSLKLMADAGLAGLPNAGKSSLLRRISNARPKVADYPFTTIEPMLGVVGVPRSDEAFTMADVPGLLEGASEGIGLGHEFLAHLERCLLIVHVVDATGYYGSDPVRNFRVILEELEAHTPGLGSRPQIVVLNKFDVLSEDDRSERLETFQEEVRSLRGEGHPAFAWGSADEPVPVRDLVVGVSAITGEGLDILRGRLGVLLARRRTELLAAEEGAVGALSLDRVPGGDAGDLIALETPSGAPVEEPEETGHVLWRPAARHREFGVRWADGSFLVEGEGVERLVRRFDVDNPEAARYLGERLDRLGVYEALREAGAAPGDEVRIGEVEFEFE